MDPDVLTEIVKALETQRELEVESLGQRKVHVLGNQRREYFAVGGPDITLAR